jgi:hypothetical protein
MSTPLKRREAFKKVAAASGLFMLAGAVSGASKTKSEKVDVSLGGEWVIGDKPCAIFQQGRMLLLVNEKGELGSAKINGGKTIQIFGGSTWKPGLLGQITEKGKVIVWANDVTWIRSE